MSVKAFPQIQQSPSGYALPGAKRFLTESLGFQFYEHSVKLPKLQETRRTKSRYGSLKSPLCSCVSITLPDSAASKLDNFLFQFGLRFVRRLSQSLPLSSAGIGKLGISDRTGKYIRRNQAIGRSAF